MNTLSNVKIMRGKQDSFYIGFAFNVILEADSLKLGCPPIMCIDERHV